jgi:hypothetical protein
MVDLLAEHEFAYMLQNVEASKRPPFYAFSNGKTVYFTYAGSNSDRDLPRPPFIGLRKTVFPKVRDSRNFALEEPYTTLSHEEHTTDYIWKL